MNKPIKAAFLFPNGMLAVFDIEGNQVGELQGLYSIEKHQEIIIRRTKDAKMEGFGKLPQGFLLTAYSYAEHELSRMKHEKQSDLTLG